jgi:serine phosphatase RsbU (regulator of sigma subunit)
MPAPGRRHLRGPVWIVAVAGVAITVVLAIAARAANEDNEQRLLDQRTREAALVLEAAVPTVQAPLAELSRLVEALPADAPSVREVAERLATEPFSTVAVGTAGEELVTVGSPARADDVDALVDGFATGGDGEAAGDSFHVIDLLDGDDPAFGYVYVGGGDPPGVVYAEQPLPPDRMSTLPPDDAFSGLDHALYLGELPERSDLVFATTMDLPLDGRTAGEIVPFGDRELLLVMSPTGALGGDVSTNLPLVVLLAGAVSTVVGSLLVNGLHRRQRESESLRREVEQLYRNEHVIAQTLQRSLLPSALPLVGAEVVARYESGARGTEVGGDWYDVVDLGEGRLVVVVGDAAGRGVRAAAVMAAVRYSANAIATQDGSPAELLQRVNRLDSVRGQFVTMVCALVDLRTGTVEIALAGHPPPLVLGHDEPRFLAAPIGPPVGFLGSAEYRSATTTLAPGATLLAFTDGLYERRGEDIDTGLERLRATAGQWDGLLDGLLDHLYDELVGERSRDDVAMLAIRMPDRRLSDGHLRDEASVP